VARTILLRIDPTATDASWQRIENGQLAGSFHKGRLAEAFRYCRGASVVVMVPAEEVFITRIPLPGKNRKKLIKAVPYAVEDQVVDDIETLHFALSSVPQEGKYIIAAVETRLIDYWDNALKAVGIHVETMIPDVLALLDSKESWSVLLEPNRALVRTPEGMFSSDIENLPLMLNNQYNLTEDKPDEVTVYDCSQANHMTTLKALCSNIEFSLVDCPDGPFSVFARHYDTRNSVNLLQGEYNRQQGIGRHVKPWIPAAGLFAVWIGWQLVVNVSAMIDLGSRSEELTLQMQDVYKSAFRGAKKPPLGYERSSMESKINKLLEKQGQAKGGLQEMLVKTAPILKNVKGVVIDGLRFSNGKLDIDLTVKGSSDVEPLEKKIKQQTGWEVKSNASTSKGVTKVRLNIKSSS